MKYSKGHKELCLFIHKRIFVSTIAYAINIIIRPAYYSFSFHLNYEQQSFSKKYLNNIYILKRSAIYCSVLLLVNVNIIKKITIRCILTIKPVIVNSEIMHVFIIAIWSF